MKRRIMMGSRSSEPSPPPTPSWTLSTPLVSDLSPSLQYHLHNLVAEEACEGWTPVSGGGGNVTSVDLLLAPRMIKLVKAFLSCQDIAYTTVILDLQRAIRKFFNFVT